MRFEREWNDTGGYRGGPLARYHEERGGILFRAVDVAHPVEGERQRLPADVRVSNLDPDYGAFDSEAFRYDRTERTEIRRCIEREAHDVELVECLPWGPRAFGRLVIRAELLERNWAVESVCRTLVVTDGGECSPLGTAADDLRERVFRAHDVHLVDGQVL